ncbi:cell division protein FtsZ [Parashewanella spongiae]|uniref:Cell division protein FtsZ n=1 Tax=Parashewanella spongiae TaxID=342950 RepID=A0A3A6TTV9_9GAMM|nr:cell division protein FtsZ [Parashewanella spongiae]MCL1078915.1 cell division protein FtsZ [Parashewanella spongiae]RJY11442.1 cell division protein FtsZ [Parashewanella spongiae]
MFEIMDTHSDEAVIKVIGVGGGGGNAVEHMVKHNIEGVEFVATNTDAQALRKSSAGSTIQLGRDVTKGLGAGANPEVGRLAAEEDKESIRSAIKGCDMIFIAAGMGGGTGTGAAPVVAQIAKEEGILTVAVVTKPFPFEGKKRMTFAEQGIEELGKNVDSLITIPNEKLLKVLGRGTSLLDAFAAANNVLLGAVQGIAELITRPGLINVDFADVKTVMSEMGNAMMGTGIASGEDRAEEAAEAAVASPLLEDIDLAGARGVLVNITAGMDMSIEEFETVGNHVKAYASDNATVVVGAVIDPEMSNELRVTVVATGIGAEKKPDITLVSKPTPRAEAAPEVLSVSRASEKVSVAEPSPDMATTTAGNVVQVGVGQASPAQKNDIDYLDIPAFLRKQAD